MSILVRSQSHYLGEYAKVISSPWASMKLKMAWDSMVTFSPILWILFFAGLTVLANFVGRQ
jgi:hypothetical protein